MSDVVRVGLIGAGPWADIFHAPMLAAAPDLDLSAVWARRPEAAAGLAHRFGAVAASSFQQLLSEVDAVAFSVPPDVQAELGAVAARAGKHLLLEKPIATTVGAARALARAVDDAGVASLVVLRNRFGRTVQDFLAATAHSPVRSVTADFVCGSVLVGSVFATPWRVAAPHALLDLGPHALDLVEATGGPILEVAARVSGGVLSISTRHTSGVSGHVVLSAVTPDAPGSLACTAITDAGVIRLADPDAQPMEQVQAEIARQFLGTVRGAIDQPLDVHRGLALQRLLAAVESSLRTGAAATVG